MKKRSTKVKKIAKKSPRLIGRKKVAKKKIVKKKISGKFTLRKKSKAKKIVKKPAKKPGKKPVEKGAVQKAKSDTVIIRVSKDIDVPLETLFKAWSDDKIRGQWLNETIYIHQETLHKSMRFDWFDGSPIEVSFSPKGKNKSQVVVEHSRIATIAQAEKIHLFWQQALEKLYHLLVIH